MSDAGDHELGELLVLLSRAHRSFRTLRAEVRVWRHHERSQLAFARRWEGRGDMQGLMMVSFGETDDGEDPAPVPSESEHGLRLWIALPDRLREETMDALTGEPGGSLLVKAGTTWWSFDPHFGATTNGGSQRHSHDAQVDATIVDPARLFMTHEFRVLGTTRHAGREAVRVEAVANRRAVVLPELVIGPDMGTLELLVDAERGVLLRRADMLDGEPYAVTEVTEIAFDEELPDALFAFEAPPGEEIRDSTAGTGLLSVPLHEAVARAPFGVFVPGAVPAGWRMDAHFSPGHERGGVPATVHVRYSDELARVSVTLNETAAGGDGLPARGPNGNAWRVEHLPIGELRLWDPSLQESAPGATAMLMPAVGVIETGGTRIHLTAQGLSAEALVELVASFVPAPADPPALS